MCNGVTTPLRPGVDGSGCGRTLRDGGAMMRWLKLTQATTGLVWMAVTGAAITAVALTPASTWSGMAMDVDPLW